MTSAPRLSPGHIQGEDAPTLQDDAAHQFQTSEDMARLANVTESDSDGPSSFVDAPDNARQVRGSKRRRLASLGHEVKAKPKELMNRLKHVSGGQTMSNRGDRDNEEDIVSDPAFNPSLVFKNDDRTTVEDRLKDSVKSLRYAGKATLHPRETIKSSAAKRITATNTPYLTREADRKLLQAHEELEQVASSKSGTDDEEIARARSAVAQIETQRDGMRAAWVTSRHVQRARVVPRHYVEFPNRAHYYIRDNNSGRIQLDWARWLGHILLYLSQDFASQYVDETDSISFNRKNLVLNAERFYIATAPWQTWLMSVRKVYLWEDPWLTGRWLALYFFLLKTGYFMTFFYCYIVYMVLWNKFYPQSADELRASYERAIDRSSRVHQIGELVERHGSDQWLDPLIQEMGPLIQQQLADTADFLEVLQNFYRWHNPRATFNTLIFWSTCAILAAFTSLEFGNKVVWWVCGLYFFASRPIASRHPKYRRAISIFRFIYWDIPTHAELAFQQLKKHAQETSNKIGFRIIHQTLSADIPSQSPRSHASPPIITRSASSSSSSASSVRTAKSYISTSVTSDSSSQSAIYPADPEEPPSVLALSCNWDSHPGRLTFTTTGIHFTRSTPSLSSTAPKKPSWSRAYSELVEIRKTRPSSSLLPGASTPAAKKLLPTKVRSSKGLVLMWSDGTVQTLERVKNRDEAFNTAIGFSGSRWMVMQSVDEAKSSTALH